MRDVLKSIGTGLLAMVIPASVIIGSIWAFTWKPMFMLIYVFAPVVVIVTAVAVLRIAFCVGEDIRNGDF